MYFQKALHRVRPCAAVISEFLALNLQVDCQNEVLARYFTGATIKHLTGRSLSEYPIPVPPLAEQRRIAAILDRADRLRRIRRYARQLGETFLQAVFVRMFGDLIESNADSFLVPLDELCLQITDGTHVTPDYQYRGVPFLSVKNVSQVTHGLDFHDVRYITVEAHR